MNCNIRCSQLSKLLQTSNSERFTCVQGLCVDMTGGLTAGVMLYRLLYWWERSKDGTVYKSWRDWDNELRIKRSASQAADQGLHRAGVDMWISNQSNGKPTKHYRLNLLRFIRRLIEVLALRGRDIIACLRGKPMLGESANVCPESRQTLTTESTLPTTTEQRVCSSDDAIPGEHLGVGAESAAPALEGKDSEPIPAPALRLFNHDLARLFTDKYGADRVAEVCRYALNPPTSIRNPAGWAVDALKDHYILGTPKADYNTFMSSLQQSFQSADDETAENSEIPNLPDADPAPLSGGILPAPAADAWSTAYQQLELQFDRMTFDTYLRGARLIEQHADVWRIAARNAHARDMLQHRLYRNVERMLRDVTGQVVVLEFIAEGGQANVNP